MKKKKTVFWILFPYLAIIITGLSERLQQLLLRAVKQSYKRLPEADITKIKGDKNGIYSFTCAYRV